VVYTFVRPPYYEFSFLRRRKALFLWKRGVEMFCFSGKVGCVDGLLNLGLILKVE
jgi:hypothetical protein